LYGVSIASRVVPATSLTTRRSSPSSLFTNELLPTFGPADHGDAQRLGELLVGRRAGGSLIDVEQVARLLAVRADTGTGSPAPRR
jgi:hypothetical protein